MSELNFPSDLFHLREGEQPLYGEFPDLKRGVEYFRSLITAEAWEPRRAAVAKRFYEMLTSSVTSDIGKGKFFDDRDLFGWYLFLGESFNDHPWNYEVIYGCRVIPVFAAIGRNLDQLVSIEGFRDRALRLIGPERSQPNGPLFEMLVAAAYARAGATVRFEEERSGGPKTYDLAIELNGKRWAVECKRIEAGEYGENERERMRELWRLPGFLLVKEERNTIVDLNFKIELADVPDSYVLRRVKKYLNRGLAFHMWSDSIALGSVGSLDITPIQEALQKEYLLHPSPQFTKLLTGSYAREESMLLLQRIQFASNPHFIDDLDLAVVARWSSNSEYAIDKKARDILKRLSDANDQLPDDVAGVIHIGFEALGSGEIERRRYNKILDTARGFDRGQSKLEYIYCHYFAPDPSPPTIWAIDETVQWIGISPKGRPLEHGKLLPSDDHGREGVHWEG